MSVQFRCPCGATLRSNTSIAGKKITCPKCGTQLQIKAAASEQTLEQPVVAPKTQAVPKAPAAPVQQASNPLESFDWGAPPSTPSPSPTFASKKSSKTPIGKWVAVGACAAAIVGGLGLFMLSRRSSITSAFRAAESTAPESATKPPTALPANANATNSTAASGISGLISGSIGPETTSASTPSLKLAEEFASYGRQGSAELCLKMIANEDFEKRLMDGPTASWEAIMKKLETPRVLGHLRSKSLESTPLDEGFRHWRVLGETQHEGQPAVLLRYYSDPEYPRQLINSSDKLMDLTQIISMEEFKSNATDLVLYNAKGRNRNAPPSMPDTHGFLPPRFGYMLLLLENSGDKPKIVDIVSVLGQVPMSQIAGQIFLRDYQVIQIGLGSEAEYRKRLDKAKAVGHKLFSFYGTVPNNNETSQFQDSIQSPALWFRPPENVSPDFKQQSNKTITDWLASHEPSRTTRLIKVANALDQTSADAAGYISDFKKQYPGDPGADLAVISFAMTSLEPRIPESLLGVIDQSAESLFRTFNDPFMLYVRGLVEQAKGDQNASDKFMQQASQAGFVTMRMLRKPFEQAVKSGEKEAVLAALKQIGDYWSSKAELDKSSNAEGQFGNLWTTAKNKADGVNSHLVQRDPISGGLGRRDPGKNPESSALGSGAPAGMQQSRARASDPSTMASDPLSGPIRREAGFAGPRGPGGPGGPGAPGAPPGGFPPPPAASSDNVRFVLQSKSAMDPNAILEKLKEKLKAGNFQMSHSGNNATITLGFAGPFDEAIRAVDFGKVTKKDETSRTINVELP